MTIEWAHIEHFSPSEFSEDPDKYAEPALIEALDAFRGVLESPIYPSPVMGALARFGGSMTSRHYAVGRKSDAIDVFTAGDIRHAWMTAFSSKIWGGIGVYFDTHYQGKPWPMLHLDLRPGKTIYWYRVNGQYGSPMNSTNDMKRLIGLLNAA